MEKEPEIKSSKFVVTIIGSQHISSFAHIVPTGHESREKTETSNQRTT